MGLMLETGRSSGSQKTQYDPNTLRMNAMRAGQLQDVIGATGGFGAMAAPRLDLAMPGAKEQNILSQIAGVPGQPLRRPEEDMALGNLRSMTRPDTSAQIGAARDIFESIVSPRIMNEMTAAGMGRSGAGLEALAMGGKELALPIATQSMSQAHDAGKMLSAAGLDLGSRYESRESDRLLRALEAAGVPRKAQYEELITRPSSMLQSMITGIPSFAGSTGGSMRGSQSEDMTRLIASLLGTFGAAAMGCWVADALYGKGSAKAIYARYWVNIGWQGPLASLTRKIYLHVGPWIAKRPWLCRLLKPLFDRAAQAGAQAISKVVTKAG